MVTNRFDDNVHELDIDSMVLDIFVLLIATTCLCFSSTISMPGNSPAENDCFQSILSNHMDGTVFPWRLITTPLALGYSVSVLRTYPG